MSTFLIGLLALAAPDPAHALVRYRITDPTGSAIPAKLTFLLPGTSTRARLDLKTKAPCWASRNAVAYTLPCDEPLPVPPGSYRVVISHGPEWTIASEEIVLAPGETRLLEVTLERVVDTRGWISSDMHLHTLTNSGHGDSNLEERVITLCAEEVEWAVATDHDYITDYAPYVKALKADRWILTTPGNEVTTSTVGHFNAFPCDPSLPPVNSRVSDPRELFRRIRADGASVIQVNHPRWTGFRGGYFRDLDLSPHTGDTSNPIFSFAFDSFEVLNSGPLCGWEYAPDAGTGDNPELDFSVREDWYHLLNRGMTPTAVGNSDSHNVDAYIGGYARNYIRSSTDDPAKASERELIESVKAGRLSVSSGIFVEASLIAAEKGEVAIAIRVQAAPWIDVDRLAVVANGEEVWRTSLRPPTPAAAPRAAARAISIDTEGRAERPLPGPGVVRHEGVFRDRPARDTWYVVHAAGDRAPVPVLHAHTFPLGFTNAIRFDADGDGKFTPLREHARRAVARSLEGTEPATALFSRETPSFRRQAVGALREMLEGPSPPPADRARALLGRLLDDEDATVRAAARSLLGHRPDPEARALLADARRSARDTLERASFDFELVRAGDLSALEDLVHLYRAEAGFRRYTIRRDILELARKTRIEGWKAFGPEPSRGWREVFSSPPRKGRRERSLEQDTYAYLNLRDVIGTASAGSVGHASFSAEAREALRTYLLCGSDNPLRIFVNGSEVYRQEPQRGSGHGSELVGVSFRPGPNEVVIECILDEPKGGFGFYLQLVDPLGVLEFGG